MKKITLSNGGEVIVDDADYTILTTRAWHLSTNGRPKRTDNAGKTIYLYRQIMDAPKDMWVDHINHDPLDNRRCNLRLATSEQSGWNRGKPKGSKCVYKGVQPTLVAWITKDGTTHYRHVWRARIQAHGVRKFLGMWNTPEEAARAYDAAARKLHGEFAYTNYQAEESNGQG